MMEDTLSLVTPDALRSREFRSRKFPSPDLYCSCFLGPLRRSFSAAAADPVDFCLVQRYSLILG